LEETSKIAPHQLDARSELGEALLQVFDMFGHENSSGDSLHLNARS
jgi:hypothetical protein